MPNSPHSSWNLSSSSRAVASADMSLKAAPPRARDAVHVQIHEARLARPDPQPVTPDPSDEAPRDPELAHQLLEVAGPVRLDRHHHARRPFPEERQIHAAAARSQVDLRSPRARPAHAGLGQRHRQAPLGAIRSEEHTSELQSHVNLVCRLLLEKKKKKQKQTTNNKTKKNNK